MTVCEKLMHQEETKEYRERIYPITKERRGNMSQDIIVVAGLFAVLAGIWVVEHGKS